MEYDVHSKNSSNRPGIDPYKDPRKILAARPLHLLVNVDSSQF